MALPVPKEPVADTPQARAYNRMRRRLELADIVLSVAMLLVLVLTGWANDLRDLAYRMAFENYGLAVFYFVLLLSVISKFFGLPLDYYAYLLEHRFHLSNLKLGGWIVDQLKGFGVTLVLATIVVELIYWTIRSDSQSWWLYAWAAFVLLVVVLAQLAPVILLPLFYKFKPLENEDLVRRLTLLGERAGTRVRGVYEWKLSEKSKKANAALTGLGATRRIILADTLLEKYTPEEIEAVLAHELGHHVHRHILKSIGVQVVITLLGFWAADQALEWSITLGLFELKSDFANLPLLVLVSTALSLLLVPVLNAYSRYNEREADRYSWQAIDSVEPFITAMNKLADQNLAEREPSRIVELLFHSHPPISKRVAAARAFKKV